MEAKSISPGAIHPFVAAPQGKGNLEAGSQKRQRAKRPPGWDGESHRKCDGPNRLSSQLQQGCSLPAVPAASQPRCGTRETKGPGRLSDGNLRKMLGRTDGSGIRELGAFNTWHSPDMAVVLYPHQASSSPKARSTVLTPVKYVCANRRGLAGNR